MIGIYKITNKLNGKCYIGQSVDIKRRWKEHLKVKDNSIFHIELQYMPHNFTFEVIEQCEKSLLNERESYWIAYYNSFNDGYNLTKGNSIDTYEKYRSSKHQSFIFKEEWKKLIDGVKEDFGESCAFELVYNIILYGTTKQLNTNKPFIAAVVKELFSISYDPLLEQRCYELNKDLERNKVYPSIESGYKEKILYNLEDLL